MRIIVVGAGPVGEHFVSLAVESGHEVVLVEADAKRAEHCVQHYDAMVLNASIDEEDILDEAGAGQAEALIATTDDDSTNLMAMVLGQEYNIESLTSTVNARHHKRLFDRLGANTLVDPEILVARHLLDLILQPQTESVSSLPGRGQIYELTLDEGSVLAGRSFADIDDENLLPEHVFIAHIARDNKGLYPRENLRLRAGDSLFVFSPEPMSDNDVRVFCNVRT